MNFIKWSSANEFHLTTFDMNMTYVGMSRTKWKKTFHTNYVSCNWATRKDTFFKITTKLYLAGKKVTLKVTKRKVPNSSAQNCRTSSRKFPIFILHLKQKIVKRMSVCLPLLVTLKCLSYIVRNFKMFVFRCWELWNVCIPLLGTLSSTMPKMLFSDYVIKTTCSITYWSVVQEFVELVRLQLRGLRILKIILFYCLKSLEGVWDRRGL
jgi:hypothetical protein